MLSAYRDAGRATARNDDVVYEARKRRNAAHEEGGHRTPIRRKSRRVPVDAMEVVHVRYRDPAPADDIVAVEWFSGNARVERDVTSRVNVLGHEDRCHWTQENSVPAKEGEELCGRREDFPLRIPISGTAMIGHRADLQGQRPSYQ